MSGLLTVRNGAGRLRGGVRPYISKAAEGVSHSRVPPTFDIVQSYSEVNDCYYVPHRIRDYVTLNHIGVISAVSTGGVIATASIYDEDGARLFAPVDILGTQTGYVRSAPFSKTFKPGELVWIAVQLLAQGEVYGGDVSGSGNEAALPVEKTLDRRKVNPSHLGQVFVGHETAPSLAPNIDLLNMDFVDKSSVLFVEAE